MVCSFLCMCASSLRQLSVPLHLCFLEQVAFQHRHSLCINWTSTQSKIMFPAFFLFVCFPGSTWDTQKHVDRLVQWFRQPQLNQRPEGTNDNRQTDGWNQLLQENQLKENPRLFSSLTSSLFPGLCLTTNVFWGTTLKSRSRKCLRPSLRQWLQLNQTNGCSESRLRGF